MQVSFNTETDLARLDEFYAAAIQASAVDFDVVLAPLTKVFQLALPGTVALFNRYGIDKPGVFLIAKRKVRKIHRRGQQFNW